MVLSILISVLVGYILGVAPIIFVELKQMSLNKLMKSTGSQEVNDAQELFDEWLNGKSKESVEPDQEKLFKEYVGGE